MWHDFIIKNAECNLLTHYTLFVCHLIPYSINENAEVNLLKSSSYWILYQMLCQIHGLMFPNAFDDGIKSLFLLLNRTWQWQQIVKNEYSQTCDSASLRSE